MRGNLTSSKCDSFIEAYWGHKQTEPFRELNSSIDMACNISIYLWHWIFLNIHHQKHTKYMSSIEMPGIEELIFSDWQSAVHFLYMIKSSINLLFNKQYLMLEGKSIDCHYKTHWVWIISSSELWNRVKWEVCSQPN